MARTAKRQKAKIYSPFLKKYLRERQVKRASLRSIRRLDIARFKVLMAAFKKWNIKTVADILKIRPRRILKIKGVGRAKLDILTATVKGVVFGKISADADQPSREVSTPGLLLGRKLSQGEKQLLGNVSVDSVIDDVRTRRALQSLGKKTVISATQVTREQFLSTRNAGKNSLGKAIESIEGIIKELACKDHSIKLDEENIKHTVDEHILSWLPQQQIMILKDRYGLWDGIIETLEDISHKYNITRERVRQIQMKAEDSLLRMLMPRLFATRVLNQLKKFSHEELKKTCSGLASIDDLENAVFKIDNDAQTVDLAYKMLKEVFCGERNPLAEGLVQCGEDVVAFDNATKSRFEKICSACELALVSKGKPQSPDDLASVVSRSVSENVNSAFLKRCCELSPGIGLDAIGKIGLKRWSHFNARSLEQMMRSALAELGTPSHYSYITAKMNVLFPHRAPFSERSVHSRLSMHPNLFVWAGRRGTYALVDWGIKQYPCIKDFLAQELTQAGDPVPEDELVSRGIAKYGYREASIRMTLAFQKRIFKKLTGGSYILNR